MDKGYGGYICAFMRFVQTHFILYVADQRQSTDFYRSVLEVEPDLNVPGMTEFRFAENTVLGLMPEDGIVRLLGDAITHPSKAGGIPRSEIYFVVDDAERFHRRSLSAGASELSAPAIRDWGHLAAYSLDLDGHVLAFASVLSCD